MTPYTSDSPGSAVDTAQAGDADAPNTDFVAHSSDAICVIANQRIAYTNPAGLRLVGVDDQADVVGRHITDFVDVRHAPKLLSRLDAVNRAASSLAPERWVLRRGDGGRVEAECTSSTTIWQGRPAILTVLRDISERPAATWADQEFSDVIASFPDGVIVVLPGGVVQTINAAALRILDSDEAAIREGIKGKHSRYVVPIRNHDRSEVAPNDLPHLQTQRSGEPAAFELEICRPNREPMWISGVSQLVDGSDPNSPTVTIFRDVTAQRALSEQLEYRATHDALTGLPNRNHVLTLLHRALGESGRRELAVLFVDLDNLKSVNDSLGHSIGDDVLRVVGDRICRAVPDDDVVGRMGGDEFVVVLNGGDEQVDTVAAAIHASLAREIRLDSGGMVSIRASVGAVVAAAGTRTVRELLGDADRAMYAAKSDGGNRTVRFASISGTARRG